MTESNRSGNAYENRDPRNHIKDWEPRALYWYPYRERYMQLQGRLRVGQPIPRGLSICVVGNNSLNPFAFDLRRQDRSQIHGFKLPGKSAHISFSDDRHIICGAIFDRDARRQDHIYTADTDSLARIGYTSYYLPTDNQPLHVRLVHESFRDDPDRHMPPWTARIALARLFAAHELE